MSITLLDVVKSKGTSHLKWLILKNNSDNKLYQINNCSKHRNRECKIITLDYTNIDGLKYEKLSDHYDDEVLI